MILPRMLAMSEVVWSGKSQRNLQDFNKRLENHYDRFVCRNLIFRVPPPLGPGGKRYIFQKTEFEMRPPLPTASIFYRLDGLDPTSQSIKYTAPLVINNDQTVRAITVLTNGRKSNPIATNFFLVDKDTNGLEYLYYEGEWDSLPNFENLQPVRSGRGYNVDLDVIEHRGSNFAVQFKGEVRIDRDGEYTFYINSDDGSELFIDDREIINNNGLHGPRELSGQILLTAGKHKIEAQYFQRSGGRILEISFEGPELEKQFIHPRLFTIQ
jgi:hypothetical protein